MANSLGLNEFNVLKVYEDETGRSLMYEVERINPPRLCPKCGTIGGAFYRHTSEERIVEDIPAHGKLVYLKIKTGRFKCQDCKATFQEDFDCIDGRERITSRFRDYIKERSLNYTFTDIANEFNLSVNTVRRIFQEYAEENAKKLKYIAPHVLGIDEAHLNKIMRCVVTDTENNLLLDVLPDRETSNIIGFLRKMPENQNIKVVTMDMYRPYKLAVYKALPSAKIVVDKFHVIQLINRKMDEVRKSIRKNLTTEEKKSLLYIAKLMKTNYEDLSPRSMETLQIAFKKFPQLDTAFYLKEEVRDIYKAKNRKEAGKRFLQWCQSVPDDCEPFKVARNTYQEWANEIFNYFDYPYTNAFTESENNLIKKLDKEGRSLSFEQLRNKILFSTKATKLPKFHYKEADYTRSNCFSKMVLLAPEVVIDEGFGVDLKTLSELL